MRMVFMGSGVARWAALVAASIAMTACGGCGQRLARTPEDECRNQTTKNETLDQLGYERCLLGKSLDFIRSDDHKTARRILGLVAAPRFLAESYINLAYMAMADSEHWHAQQELDKAELLANEYKDQVCRARSQLIRSQLFWATGKYADAVRSADVLEKTIGELSIRDLEAHDPPKDERYKNSLRVKAGIAKADGLRRAGVTAQACVILAEMIALAQGECDRAWASVKYAMCQEEMWQYDEAKKWLQAARDSNCQRDDIVKRQILMNEALQHLLDGEEDLAEKKIEETVLINSEEDADTLLHRAYLASARGLFPRAIEYLDEAIGMKSPDQDVPWAIELAYAELFLRQNNFVQAEACYQSSIREVEILRDGSRSQASYLMESHQAPYEGLVALLADKDRLEDALAVVLALDSSDMLRAAAQPVAAASQVAPLATREHVKTIVSRWQGQDVVVLLAPPRHRIGTDEPRALSLRIRGGQISKQDLGPAKDLRRLIATLNGSPERVDIAHKLGTLLLPPDWVSQPLHVLPIGLLSEVPLPLLRRADRQLALKTGPLIRLSALQTATPPVEDEGGPTVLVGSPRGNLPESEKERDNIAERLRLEEPTRGVIMLGARAMPATQHNLLNVSRPGLLHIAAHVVSRGLWRALELQDELVDAPRLLAGGLAPSLAVLANCGSAGSASEDSGGSVANALIEAGTPMVVATRHSIPDAEANVLMNAFYAQRDWRKDPAGALAKVQLDAAEGNIKAAGGGKVPERVWSAFMAISRPVYVPPQQNALQGTADRGAVCH